MTRHEQRQELLLLLFEQTFKNGSRQEIFQDAADARDLVITDYISECFDGIIENTDKLDEYISENLQGWVISRISRVNLSILRIAVYEMLYRDDIPIGAAINESVDLAKEFSGDDDWSFINGVLSSIAKKHAPADDKK